MMWLRLMEGWLIARLLASPTFHRGVRKVHKTVHEARHGKGSADVGGTSIDTPSDGIDGKRFLRHFTDELKNQFRGKI